MIIKLNLSLQHLFFSFNIEKLTRSSSYGTELDPLCGGWSGGWKRPLFGGWKRSEILKSGFEGWRFLTSKVEWGSGGGYFGIFRKKSGILKWLFYLQTFWWNFQIFLMFGWFFSFDFKGKIIPIEPLHDNITRENFQKLWIEGWISGFGNKSGQSKLLKIEWGRSGVWFG